jgi:two-component system, chemotaxis family, protein-glutamate methylesterase/glutaminase
MSSRLFVIGASHSGLQALCSLVADLPANFPAPVFIVQHTAREGHSRLPEFLSAAGPLPAAHARSGEFIRPGHIYVAPPDHHMLVRPKYVWLSRGPRENHTRPAVDPLFRSAALAYGAAVVGVVLTGYLDDGTAGAIAVKARGGTVIVQNPAEATAPSMPTSALNHVPDVDHCGNVKEIAALLVQLAGDDPPTVASLDARVQLEIEDRAAEGKMTAADWNVLAGLGRFSGLSCPECHGPLCELPDKNMLRFRCHCGHAYSAQSLASAKSEEADALRSALLAALSEESALADRALAEPAYRREPLFAGELTRRSSRLMVEAHQVRNWSTGMLEGSGIEPLAIPPNATASIGY